MGERNAYIEEEPGASRAKKDFAMLPLAVVAPEVAPGGLGRVETLTRVLEDGSSADFVGFAFSNTCLVGFDVLDGLLGVAGYIESITWCLGDGETEVQGDAAWDGTKTDYDTPHLVDSELADARAVSDGLRGRERVLEAGGDDECDDGGGELADTLHGKDGSHHGSTPFGGCKFGGDDWGNQTRIEISKVWGTHWTKEDSHHQYRYP
jgi:hypothetical protein